MHTKSVTFSLISTVILISLTAGQSQWTQDRYYSIIFDAGSTGTRIHIFEFSPDNARPTVGFKLESATFKEIKPGLSSYAKNPKSVLVGIEELLNKAKEVIPSNKWSQTPLALRATAGLRLLPPQDAQALLDEVKRYFAASPFVTDDDSAIIMSGVNEGIFAWTTLVFQLDRINAALQKPDDLAKKPSMNLTAAALDLGGASTQVTFRPIQKRTIQTAPPSFIKQISLFGRDIQLYTHSYLGNGLYAARLNNLKLSSTLSLVQTNGLQSSCFPMGYSVKYDYNGTEFTVSGLQTYSYASCASEVGRFIANSHIEAPRELAMRDIYAFSYFFDRGLQTNMINSEDGAPVFIRDFGNKAREGKMWREFFNDSTDVILACSRNSNQFGKEEWSPWLCLDLTYIYSLLSQGYRLPSGKQIFLAKKIKDMETSWALGAAYQLLNSYNQQNTARDSGMEQKSWPESLFGILWREFVEKVINIGRN